MYFSNSRYDHDMLLILLFILFVETPHDSAGEVAQCCHMRSFLLSSPLAAVTPQRNERNEKAEDGTLYISLR